MRIVAGATILVNSISTLFANPSVAHIVLDVLTIAASILLLAGLLTPVAGSLVAALAAWHAVSQTDDRTTMILLATIGGALALVGPGVWSIDARLFGWKRIDVRHRKS